MFDNVFVNPAAYRVFQATGTWPDKTTLVLEIRGAEGPSSINKRGHSQSSQIMGMELHVKDARLEGGWGFFEFTGPETAKLIKRPAGCYQCHEGHGAVDTTFVQFYPTMLDVAKTKGTLSPAYLKEISTAATDKWNKQRNANGVSGTVYPGKRTADPSTPAEKRRLRSG